MEDDLTPFRMMLGFFAGFIGVLVAQQPLLALLYALHVAARAPYSTEMTMPMGRPYVWSMAFWGGVWGILLGMFHNRWREGPHFWRDVALFGAIVPTAFSWITTLVMTHHPFGGHWAVGVVLTPFMINAVWALATEVILAGLWIAWRVEG